MKCAKTMGLGLLVGALAMTGCSRQNDTAPTGQDNGTKEDGGSTEARAHAHGTGPNGGVVFDLGRYHAEFTVDHTAKACTVLVLSGDGPDAEALPVAAEELTLSIRETTVKEGVDKGKVVPPMTMTLKPVDPQGDKAAKFVGTDPGLGNVADFEGAVFGEIDGKPSQGEFKE